MKLHILSDLHLGHCGFERPRNDADVVILAGDVARPREAVAWARQFDKPVLYVPGNHEFYGSSLEEVASELEGQSAGTCVHVLANAEIVIDRVRFLGTTLWTDFALFGEGEKRAAAMTEAQTLMRDFSRIHKSFLSALQCPDNACDNSNNRPTWPMRPPGYAKPVPWQASSWLSCRSASIPKGDRRRYAIP
jgi:hypothetical protein